MHRIPLHMVSELCPEDSEYVTMSKVMSPRNLIECELFLKVLRKESEAVFGGFSISAQNSLDISKECLKMRNPKVLMKTLHSLDEIICRAPTATTTFVDAILARSLLYMKSNQHAIACTDLLFYEALDPTLKSPAGTIVSQILLCISLYMNREYQASKDKLASIKDLIGKTPLSDKSEIGQFITLIEQYEERITQARKNVEFNKKVQSKSLIPYEGYKLSRKIPYTSQACEYLEKTTKKPAGVYASREIPKGELVLVENPVCFQFSAPFLNCDVCGLHQELLYSCENCRYRTYCSKLCMESDADIHIFECYGYRIGVIPMLEASMLFRLFVEAGDYILPALVDYAMEGGIISKPREAWNFILDHAKEEDKKYKIIGELLATAPDYSLITKEKYFEIVTIAFRLSVFIFNDTELADKYFYLLAVVKTDLIIVIAAMLLRLAGHVLLKSQRDEFYYPKLGEVMNETHEEFTECDALPVPIDRIIANAFSYYGVDGRSDFVDCYNKVHDNLVEDENEMHEKFSKDSPIFKFVDRLHSIFIKKCEIETVEQLMEAKTLPAHQVDEILEMSNTSKRCQLLTIIAKYFHEFVHQYFNKFENTFQSKATLCITLNTFKQNCATENVKIISLPNGKFVGVTERNVAIGEELVLCPEFIKHRDQNIILNLAHCKDLNFSSKINHGKPSFEKTASPEFLRHNNAFISAINNKILAWKHSRQDPKLQLNLSILYGTYNSFLALHCEENDEIRLMGVLKFSMFLAINGFLQHASDNMLHLVELIELEDIYFKEVQTYRKVLRVIQSIMEQYINIMTEVTHIGPDYPKTVLVSCSLILKRLQLHVEALIDNAEASALYMEYSSLHYKWKTLFNSFILMPPGLRHFLVDSNK
ncbi:LOW QUALITY PROTEIN: uncharacterized protein LOC108117277 [Drosophila eugracilis]|uniref:LOW QUALITY PROTEIN: uncharacterized protein LOC108117277 n=1 Tax=Drosophila eugracilis TaxID=29029 RepID=UPI001BDB6C85|nr:LOW QUALITY PROTEIN: uncharacterized protein LOC108117277 [Drosophila eugracilis]